MSSSDNEFRLIHEPDRPEMMDWWGDKDNYEGPVMDVLNELKANGKIKYPGLGGTTAYEMGHIIDTGKFDKEYSGIS